MKPSTPEVLISEIQEGRHQWDAAVAGLSDEDVESAEIVPGWTLKMLMGHLAAYLRLNAAHLRAYTKRKHLASMRARNWNQFNKREAEKLKEAPLARVRADFEAAYAELCRRLPTLSETDLKQSFPSPWSAKTTHRTRLTTVLRADVSNHFGEHARQVLAWRGKHGNAES